MTIRLKSRDLKCRYCANALAASSAIAAALCALPAHALTTPGPCGADAHIRCAVFDSSEVYRVPFRAGTATLIQLEPGEVIDGPASGIGMGDSKAWKVGAKSNWILFKPTEAHADTNLIVVTDRRRYAIELVTADRGEAAVWSLNFTYPDTRSRETQAAARKQALAADRARSSAATSLHANENYDMQGDTVLAPTSMWDDGRFTYFRYATTRDLPDINRVLPDGSEALVNSHVDGDTVVVHETAAKFMLRLGKSVLGVRNNGYTPDGQFNTTGTAVPGTVRITKEHE
ncbi:TrbG/VirB9 family P-type conjugative transfer protein [Caballeronia sp. SBC2]|uniref:TrbG/VirB9 family P-type conjugative transfer protein n=1 Tax=Caballeronia sp. SBC2 TaxID=2705547 RepID=UPI0013E1507C|nr:TrbG/VirB9 family P-type conjugative transfer protein [Caballeronia sp. SBC2]QIE29044.1 Type IV secretion system protein virB9 [Caballeronia sp. SBC2]